MQKRRFSANFLYLFLKGQNCPKQPKTFPNSTRNRPKSGQNPPYPNTNLLKYFSWISRNFGLCGLGTYTGCRGANEAKKVKFGPLRKRYRKSQVPKSRLYKKSLIWVEGGQESKPPSRRVNPSGFKSWNDPQTHSPKKSRGGPFFVPRFCRKRGFFARSIFFSVIWTFFEKKYNFLNMDWSIF